MKTFISSILSIILSILIITTVLIFNISSFSNKENIQKSINNTNLALEVKKIRNSGSSEGQTKIVRAINDIYSLASEYGIPEGIVDQMIDSETTKEMLGKSIGNLTDYIINGNNVKILTVDDTYEIISNNLDKWLEEANINVSKNQKNKFLNRVKTVLPDIVEAIPQTEDLISSNYKEKINLLQKVFSKNSKMWLAVGIVITTVLIIILKKLKSLKYIGISLLISGLIIMGSSLLIPSFIVDLMNETDISLFASSLTDYLDQTILTSGIIIVVISTIFLIIYKIKPTKIE